LVSLGNLRAANGAVKLVKVVHSKRLGLFRQPRTDSTLPVDGWTVSPVNNTLDPKFFYNIQDLFTKFKYFLLSLGECGIHKSTQEKKIIQTMLSKLEPEYVVYVSNFHSGICLFGANWKMPTMAQFIESLTQEQKKLIHMCLIKDPKIHALTMHDGNRSSKKNRKEKHNEKEGYSKHFNDSSGSKDSSYSKKNKKGKQCT
jgi:hypothetical protein